MASCISHHGLAVLFGILGNFVSFLVYFAPMVTFYDIYRVDQRKTIMHFHTQWLCSVAMLMLYYAYLKGQEAVLLITINSFGCVIETVYLVTFFTFANSRTRTVTTRLILVLNTVVYLTIVLLTWTISPTHRRVVVVGWICAVFSVCVYAAPLSVMRTVIRTKNVKYMPFPLSVCLTQSAIIWFFYGVFSHDYFVATPNVLGFIFGVAQIILHIIYRKGSTRRKTPSQTENEANAMNKSSSRNVCIVIELVETMSHQSNNSDEDEKDEIHESNDVDGVVAGNNNNKMDNNDSEIHLVDKDEIVEIPDVAKSSNNVTFVNEGPP